jgi:hypothetical protein
MAQSLRIQKKKAQKLVKIANVTGEIAYSQRNFVPQPHGEKKRLKLWLGRFYAPEKPAARKQSLATRLIFALGKFVGGEYEHYALALRAGLVKSRVSAHYYQEQLRLQNAPIAHLRLCNADRMTLDVLVSFSETCSGKCSDVELLESLVCESNDQVLCDVVSLMRANGLNFDQLVARIDDNFEQLSALIEGVFLSPFSANVVTSESSKVSESHCADTDADVEVAEAVEAEAA